MKIYEKDGVVRMQVHVQPRASTSEIVGEHGDSIKVRIAAPPVDGEANAELERYLAKLIGTARSNVTVTGGAGSRQKTVAISNVALAVVRAAVERAIQSGR